MYIIGRMFVLIVAAAVPVQAARAQTDPSINAFVTSFATSIREIHAQMGAGDGKSTERCRALVARAFDLDTMARSALGAAWEKLTPFQRDAYRAAFERRIASDCVRRIREYRGEEMTLLGVRSGEGGDRLAATRFAVRGEAGRILTWRLRPGGSPPRALDLIVDGRSLLLSAREEYAAVLQSHNGDINALIEFMLR